MICYLVKTGCIWHRQNIKKYKFTCRSKSCHRSGTLRFRDGRDSSSQQDRPWTVSLSELHCTSYWFRSATTFKSGRYLHSSAGWEWQQSLLHGRCEQHHCSRGCSCWWVCSAGVIHEGLGTWDANPLASVETVNPYCIQVTIPSHITKTEYQSIVHLHTSLLRSIHSFYWHVQNLKIPCCSQDLLPFLSVIYPFLPPFSTN